MKNKPRLLAIGLIVCVLGIAACANASAPVQAVATQPFAQQKPSSTLPSPLQPENDQTPKAAILNTPNPISTPDGGGYQFAGNSSPANGGSSASRTPTFRLNSPDLPADGRLPAEYTCDGASATLALTWSGAPAETVGYAVTMHHVAPDNGIHWYWEIYNLPASVTRLPKNVTGQGTLGTNSVNDRNEYAPPCSKGPGDKLYIYTVYALSAQPQISVPAAKVNRAALLAAIKDITLASAELRVVYARP